jgi:hypothetical protein
MNRTFFNRSLSLAIAAVLWLTLAPQPAAAHDGPSRLEFNADHLPPGGTLEIRGINIAAELPVFVTLYGDGIKIELREAIGDEHGDFIHVIVLPTDLAVGEYVVQASSPSLVTVGARLTIEGSPVLSGEAEGGPRNADEPLLAPLPSGRILSTVQTGPSAAPSTSPAQTDSATLWIGLGGLVLLALVFGLRKASVRGSNARG